MSLIDRYKKLERLAESHKEKRAGLKGSLKVIINQLKEKGFKSPKEATQELKEIDKRIELENNNIETLSTNFESQYADELQKLD